MTAAIRRIFTVGFILLWVLVAGLTVAQETAAPPQEIDAAFDLLSQRLGETVSFTTVSSYQWASLDFPDAALGCPDPREVYAQVVTPGYRFLINYDGTQYVVHVSEDGQNAVLCDSRPASPSYPTLVPATPDPAIVCDETYTIREGDTLSEIAAACGTTVAALMNANPQIEFRWLIYPGTAITIPDGPDGGSRAVNIRPDSGAPGTVIYLTASGFPPGETVEIGMGPVASEYEVLASREVGADGELAATLQVSEEARQDQRLVGVVVLDNEETISEPFTVTDEVRPAPMPTPTEQGALFVQTQIYLVALGDAGRTGALIGCDDSLVPVTVDIDPTVAPLTAALDTLFDMDTRTYGQSGLYNALYRSDLQVDRIAIENGEAAIWLTGEVTTGGVCDVPRIEAQLRQTALQYDTVDTVTVYVNGQPLTDAL